MEFTRVFKAQIEDEANIELKSDSCVIQWIIRWAAMVTSRYLVGKDGMTGHERRRGRRCKLPVVTIGEKVQYKEIRETKERRQKLASDVKEGIWLGHGRSSSEAA